MLNIDLHAVNKLLAGVDRVREVLITRSVMSGQAANSSTSCLNNTVVPPTGGGKDPIRTMFMFVTVETGHYECPIDMLARGRSEQVGTVPDRVV